MADVDGSWDCTVKSPLGDQNLTLTVQSDGGSFTGTASGVTSISAIHTVNMAERSTAQPGKSWWNGVSPMSLSRASIRRSNSVRSRPRRRIAAASGCTT